MQIHVQLFSILRDCLPPGTERGQATLSLPRGTRLADLVAHLGLDRRLGAVASKFTAETAWQVIVNGRSELEMERSLQDGDQVQIFPPMAGG